MNLERLILGCIINDAEIQDQIIPQLNIDYFYQNRQLAELLLLMYSKHEPIDLVTVAKKLPENIPLSTLTEISRRTVADTVNIMAYIQALKEDYLRHQIEKIFGIELQHNDSPYEFLNDKINELEQVNRYSSVSETLSLVDMIIEAEKPDKDGLMCSLTELNKLNQFKPGHLVVIGGRPSHGKTLLALSLTRDFCMQGKKVIFFSLEMMYKELIKRLMMSTDPGDISKWDFQIFDRAGVDVNYIRSHTRINKPDIIFIDYLAKIRGGTGEKKTYQIEDNVNLLKNLAKDCGIPIVLLAQASRDIEKRNVKKFEMSDLADSKGIEAEADLVVFAARYEYWDLKKYKDGRDTEDSILLQVAKNRHGGGMPNIYTKINKLLLKDYFEVPEVAENYYEKQDNEF